MPYKSKHLKPALPKAKAEAGLLSPRKDKAPMIKFLLTKDGAFTCGDTKTGVTPGQAAQALQRIRNAETDLGRLSPGQRRDLLKDNFEWDGLLCDAAADLITEMDGGGKAVTDASFAAGGFNCGMPRVS